MSAILAGPGALSNRFGGRLGKWIAAVHSLLNRGDVEPVRISMGVVKRVGVKVELIVAGRDLKAWELQRWARDNIVLKIPGAGHAPE